MIVRVIFFMMILPISLFAQKKYKLVDATSGNPIPFVNIWVKNQNVGTSSSKNGIFELPERVYFSDTLVFSAVGYFDGIILFKNLADTFLMMPRTYELGEIMVKAGERKKQLWIGAFKRNRINLWYAGSQQPNMMAGFFPYKAEYFQTPCLIGIEMFLNSYLPDVKVNIRLMKPDSAGFPGENVFHRSLVMNIRKGKHVQYLDLSEYSIIFPPEGLFVALEWIVIPENNYQVDYFDKKTLQNKTVPFYQPEIGVIPLETNDLTYMYTGGSWRKIWKHQSEVLPKYSGKYPFPAFRLLLTN